MNEVTHNKEAISQMGKFKGRPEGVLKFLLFLAYC